MRVWGVSERRRVCEEEGGAKRACWSGGKRACVLEDKEPNQEIAPANDDSHLKDGLHEVYDEL